jgi:two-component system nitrogen regulation response regulator GlnG
MLRDEGQEGDFDTLNASIDGTDWQSLAALVDKWLAEGETDLYRRALEHFDRILISRTLNHSEGLQARASELLGLSRVTLRLKLRTTGLAVEKHVTSQHANAPASSKP